MRTLLYQCPAGICGDMNLGAMIALGVNPEQLQAELRKLPLSGWSLNIEEDKRSGIAGTRCDVVLEELSEEAGHAHTHSHRTFLQIREMIEQSELSDAVKTDAVASFQVLAEAEAAVHGVAVETVHFHEVGAVDSIIDMVGAAICWELLGVDAIACSTLELGGGTVKCAHGIMPVPAPATARLVEGMPVTYGGTDKEATTPTGAALLKGKGAQWGQKFDGTCEKNGVGIGQRVDANLANVLYVSLIETDAATESTVFDTDTVWEISANIDDMTAEAQAYLRQQILDAGALDVWETPAVFKKGRSGSVITALAYASKFDQVRAAFFQESRTLGVRYHQRERSKLQRELVTVDTPWGSVSVKQSHSQGHYLRQKIDFDDCSRIAQAEGISLAEVEQRLAPYLPELKSE